MPSEQSVEFHPKEEDYVDEHPYVLHMWRYNVADFPLPIQSDYDSNQITQSMLLPRKNGYYNVNIVETTNWKRVRISLLDKYGHPLDRFPKWDEMCVAKQMFFAPDEAVIQIHPSEDMKKELDSGEFQGKHWGRRY